MFAVNFTTGVTIPDEFTGEEVFATQLNEDDYPGLSDQDKTRKGNICLYFVRTYSIKSDI